MWAAVVVRHGLPEDRVLQEAQDGGAPLWTTPSATRARSVRRSVRRPWSSTRRSSRSGIAQLLDGAPGGARSGGAHTGPPRSRTARPRRHRRGCPHLSGHRLRSPAPRPARPVGRTSAASRPAPALRGGPPCPRLPVPGRCRTGSRAPTAPGAGPRPLTLLALDKAGAVEGDRVEYDADVHAFDRPSRYGRRSLAEWGAPLAARPDAPYGVHARGPLCGPPHARRSAVGAREIRG